MCLTSIRPPLEQWHGVRGNRTFWPLEAVQPIAVSNFGMLITAPSSIRSIQNRKCAHYYGQKRMLFRFPFTTENVNRSNQDFGFSSLI